MWKVLTCVKDNSVHGKGRYLVTVQRASDGAIKVGWTWDYMFWRVGSIHAGEVSLLEQN